MNDTILSALKGFVFDLPHQYRYAQLKTFYDSIPVGRKVDWSMTADENFSFRSWSIDVEYGCSEERKQAAWKVAKHNRLMIRDLYNVIKLKNIKVYADILT